jgi:hypothetical protein
MASTLLPVPLPGECIYSIAAHHAGRWFQGATTGTAELLGSTTPAARDLPTKLDSVARQFAPALKLTGQLLLERHTAVPLHLPFLDSLSRRRASQAARFGGPLQLILGVAPSRLSSARALRLCPTCVQRDRAAYGRAYWHREHQLPGALVCSRHGRPLIVTSVRPEARYGVRKFVTPDRTNMARMESLDTREFRLMRPIARDFASLLCGPVAHPGPHKLHAYYYHQLRRAGYLRPNLSVGLSDLRADLENHYGTRLLARLACAIGPARRSDWLAALVRPPRNHQQPLRHLLLLRFLGLPVARALREADRCEPLARQSKSHPHRIRDARRLACRRPEKRQAWLQALRVNVGKSTREIQPALYAWLWRNDRSWLRAHRQSPKQRVVDLLVWAERDRRLAGRIRQIATEVHRAVPLVRASRNLIASRTGCASWLVRDHPHLSTAVAILKQSSETAERFALRRIRAVSRRLHGPIKPWRLRVACGISVKLAQNRLVALALRAVCRTRRRSSP